jgi:hypothetical protein
MEYNPVNCRCYENRNKGFSGSYSGKDDYASGMPDLHMSDYSRLDRKY